MTDGPFKSMAPDPTSERPAERGEAVKCERCGALIFAGDWPFCNRDPEDHQR